MKTINFLSFLITPSLTREYLQILPSILESRFSDIDCILYRDQSDYFIPTFLHLVAPYKKKLYLNLPLQDVRDILPLADQFDGVHLKGAYQHLIPQMREYNQQRQQDSKHTLQIGFSAHSSQEVLSALQLGADYCTLSPIFATPDKGIPLGIEVLQSLPLKVRQKVVALGGIISKEQIEQIKHLGVLGFASIRFYEK